MKRKGGATPRRGRGLFVDDELTITVTIKDILAEKGKLILTTNCVNQSGKEVLKGEAIVIPPN